jgi:hypothetical protein
MLIGGVVVSRLPEPARHPATIAVPTPTTDELVGAGPLEQGEQSTSDVPRQRRAYEVFRGVRPARSRAGRVKNEEPTRRPPA